MRPLVLVAAVARNGVIGRDGALPWRLSSDLKHFRARTWARPIVMGRKTFESIGQPLPGRESVVVSRDAAYAPRGAHMARTLEDGLAVADRLAGEMGADEIAVIGGGEIYRQTIGRADRLAITEVDLEPDGDARFPAIDPSIWLEVSRQSHPAGPKDDAGFAFVDYSRKTKAVSHR